MIHNHSNVELGPKCNTVFRVTEVYGNYIRSDIPATIGHPTWHLHINLFKVLVQHHKRISKTKPLEK